jgi:hypothetical protein
MATTTPNYGWPVPTSTDFVKDGAQAIEDLGDAIDATVFGLGTGPDTVLSSGTFTSASAVNLSSVLSNTYPFYTLNVYATVSAATILYVRFRENTTDYTAADYSNASMGVTTGGTVANYNSSSGTTLVQVTGLEVATFPSHLVINLSRPSAVDGVFTWEALDATNNRSIRGASRNRSLSNFNGISFFPAAGTFTGYYILTGRKA